MDELRTYIIQGETESSDNYMHVVRSPHAVLGRNRVLGFLLKNHPDEDEETIGNWDTFWIDINNTPVLE